MNRYLTVGLTALAGAALFEAALIPGLVIGGAAVLAPKVLPEARRRLQPLLDATVGRLSESAGPVTASAAARAVFKGPVAETPAVKALLAAPAQLGIKQALAKTVTFRIIVTVLDFTSNYVVIGEATTAAGLSTFALVVGPLFYLTHEAAWNYFNPSGEVIVAPFPSALRPDAMAPSDGGEGIAISRALAKTVTFRTIATAMDFTTLYVVVGDLATAVGLSAFGFVVGPFVYLGHEKIWDYYSARPTAEMANVPALEA